MWGARVVSSRVCVCMHACNYVCFVGVCVFARLGLFDQQPGRSCFLLDVVSRSGFPGRWARPACTSALVPQQRKINFTTDPESSWDRVVQTCKDMDKKG